MDNADLAISHPPWIFNIELTNECPFKCIMCPRTHNMTRSIGYLDFDLYCSIIDDLVEITPDVKLNKKLLRLHHFGESLVHVEFKKYIEYATQKGIRTALSINPLLLKGRVFEDLLDSGIDTLFVSLDGHDDVSFEKIRGVPDAFEKSLGRLETFLSRNSQKQKPIHIELSMIDFGVNRESINRMTEYWQSKDGLAKYRQKVFQKWDGSADDVNQLADDETDRNLDNNYKKENDCYEPWRHLTVTWDGKVVPCCFDYDAKHVLGDLNFESLMEVWNGSEMLNLRAEFLSRNVRNKLCTNCQFCPKPENKDLLPLDEVY